MRMRPKLVTLTEAEGYSSPIELIEEYITDCVCPGICTNPGCDYTTEVEPDQTEGWCEACETNTVQSALVLAGVI